MNIEIIDEWLDEEYGVSYTRLEELHDWLLDKNIEYRERIDKAIEYIESYNLPEDLGKLSECPISVNELKELLDILKGVNENEK